MNASELLSAFSDYLTGKNIIFESNAKDKWLTIPMEGDNGSWKTHVLCEDEPSLLQIICKYPIYVSAEKIKDTTLFLNNLNAELRMGSFTLSQSERNISFRVAYPIELVDSMDEQFAGALAAAFNPFDRHFHTLAAYVCESKSTSKICAKFAPAKDESCNDNFSNENRVQFN